MKFILALLFIITLSNTHATIRAGYSVNCEKNSDQSQSDNFAGRYFLDYLIARMDNPTADFISDPNEFVYHLKSKVPELARSFATIFMTYKLKLQNGSYVWQAGKFIDSEGSTLNYKLPENCIGEQIKIISSNRYNNYRIYFRYNEDDLASLSTQITWVIMNQILWDYYNSEDEVRIVNQFLHIKSSSDISSQEYIDELNKVASVQEFMSVDTYDKVYSLLVEVGKLENHLFHYPLISKIKVMKFKAYKLLNDAKKQLQATDNKGAQKALGTIIKRLDIFIEKADLEQERNLFYPEDF